MYCIGLVTKLRPGAYGKYKLAHDQIWPELAEGLRVNHVNMAIYRDGRRLFLFATAPTLEDWERRRADPVLARWNKCMAELLETDQAGQPVFTEVPKAFGFGEFQ